jgi:cobyrinic acid a,c-diamide synthase
VTGRGLILAAPASRSGKTLVATGLLRHLRHRGLRVAAAKAGPDFIDASFHTAAAGRPSINLDVWGMRPALLASLVAELEASADVVVCEGVMGLFDGTGPDGEAGSTADLARVTGWPVVLIVDTRGQGASVAAMLRGFLSHQPSLNLAGVIFNRASSDRHGAILANAVARYVPDLICVGVLPADPSLTLPSRHLGLVPAGELADVEKVIDDCAAWIATHCDIDRLLDLGRSSVLGPGAQVSPIPPLGQRIAVARDDAFCFVYPTLLDGWGRQGAELAFFSPLADEPPSPGADAVYLPGGYPELWAEWLATANAFTAGLRRAAADGKPVYGECGGYMVLGKALVDGAGRSHPMTGLLPLVTSFSERRLHLGYRCATTLAYTPLGRAGAGFRGHEFHYATVEEEDAADRLLSVTDAAGLVLGCYGLRRGSVFGSFVHLIDRCEELD